MTCQYHRGSPVAIGTAPQVVVEQLLRRRGQQVDCSAALRAIASITAGSCSIAAR